MLRRETMLQASVVDIQTHIKNHRRERGAGRGGGMSDLRKIPCIVTLGTSVYSDC